MTFISPATWGRVERLYFEGELTLKEIAARCGVSGRALSKRAKKLGWPSYQSLRLDGAASERARLRRLIEKKLTHLESRMDKPESLTEGESERHTRQFSSLLGSVTKMDDQEGDWRGKLMTTPVPAEATAAGNPMQGADNVEQWRQELARRIARLARGREQ